MRASVLKHFLSLLLLFSLSHAGLVHRRNAKDGIVQSDENSKYTPLDKEQILVTIIEGPEPELDVMRNEQKSELDPMKAADAVTKIKLKTEIREETMKEESQQINHKASFDYEMKSNDQIESENQKKIQQQELKIGEEVSDSADAIFMHVTEAVRRPDDAALITELIDTKATAVGLNEPLKADVELLSSDSITKPTKTLEEPIRAAVAGSIKAESTEKLPLTIGQQPAIPLKALPAEELAIVPIINEHQRQATQATPTQTTTPQNFVQQFIQNNPISQFLSQLTGGQQQQQENQQVAADEPVTPAPTLPGFLNPAAAITSAQQAVQTVVNSTTQAFQGLQHFATNLGTQFQNTFSNLAGQQQGQLSTSDSTTPRPPGPIQAIVSNFVGGSASTVAPGTQPQGPFQGILSFFQGGNQQPNVAPPAPPKEEPAAIEGLDNKIEAVQNDNYSQQQQQQQQQEQQQMEPDSANEVRYSEEVINEDLSLESSSPDELIVVNDDATQQAVA